MLAFVVLGLAVPANLFIKTRLTPLKGSNNSPGDNKKGGGISVWPDFSIFRDARFAVASLGIVFMELRSLYSHHLSGVIRSSPRPRRHE